MTFRAVAPAAAEESSASSRVFGQKSSGQPARFAALDAVRGLAILCMVVDHLTLVLDGPSLIRLTVGRVAMPLFFVLSGYLVRRIGWRHLVVFVVGIMLPLVVPWVDSPNVLVWYFGGVGVLVLVREFKVSPWWGVIGSLALSANGFHLAPGNSYDGAALIALMLVGSQMSPVFWAWARVLPRPLELVGRYPLTIYVGHLLLLQGLLVAGVL